MNISKIIQSNFSENHKINENCLSSITGDIETAVNMIIHMLNRSGKLMTCGNGGSSGDAQHLASEFINRFELERKELPAVSLNSDTATLTSIANDYSYEDVFSKQVYALGKHEDILLAFTTSGNSKNICKAMIAAKNKNISTILVTGNDGGDAKKLQSSESCCILVPSERTSRIQEMHLIIIHSICECIDQYIQNNS